MSLVDRAIVRTLPHVPRSVVGRVAARYIAGERLEDGIAAVRALNGEGKLATLDLLGEEVATAEETREYTELNVGVLDAIAAERLDANLSVKPTALGLEIGADVWARNLHRLLDAARAHGTFVRLDMEDSSTTSETLALYRELREEGHDNLGVVLQAALKRLSGQLMDFDGAYIGGTGETVLAWVENPASADHARSNGPHHIEALQRGAKSSFVATVIGDEVTPQFGAARSTITSDGDETLIMTVIDLSRIASFNSSPASSLIPAVSNGRSSSPICRPSAKITARSMTFSNSRTLQRHSWLSSARIAPFVSPLTCLPICRVYFSRKCSTSAGMSSLR